MALAEKAAARGPAPGQADAAGDSMERDAKSEFAVGQVTVRLPLDTRPLALLALLFGFVPWVLPIALFADLVISHRVSTVVIVTVLLVGTCVNELVLKPCINEPRPPMTANRGADDRPMPGMPSGHVFNSQTLAVWYLQLVVFEAGLPPAETTCLAVLLVAAMPLVPWARWYNGDHSAKQVIVTAGASTVFAILVFVLYVVLAPESLHDAARGSQQLSMLGQPDPLPEIPPARRFRGATRQ